MPKSNKIGFSDMLTVCRVAMYPVSSSAYHASFTSSMVAVKTLGLNPSCDVDVELVSDMCVRKSYNVVLSQCPLSAKGPCS